ncbi:hypothetical protein C5470_05215 [Photorhabdus stackebrandtii]|uniref:Uncharacterized protein n=1 Tax=Photorhabdus stackebrandtii TaxID=1123042 RepID=A0A7X5TKY8_9GAMM|nr:hypothetical protein [Photorhabdus stackebrandtii]
MGIIYILSSVTIFILLQEVSWIYYHYKNSFKKIITIPVIFQVASLLAALAHPGHIVRYAPGDSLPCRRDAS